MITYERISKTPEVSVKLIGMTLSEFDSLFVEFEKVYLERRSSKNTTVRDRKARRRKVGGGRRFRYGLQDRLILTLFWMTTHPTCKVLGEFYGINRAAAGKVLKNITSSLRRTSTYKYYRDDTDDEIITRLRSVQAVLEAYPELKKIMDQSKEGYVAKY